MPTVLRLRLRLFKDVSVPLAAAPAHGWALALIKQHDPAWSSELHPDPKPNAHKNSSAEKPRGQAPGPGGPGARPESAGVPVDEAPQPGGGAESAPPPFTTSPLYRPASTLDQDEFRLRARALRADDPDDRFAKALVCAGEVVALRLAFADDERARQLCSEWIMGEIPFLADAPCELVRAPTFSRGDPDLCYRPWPALADAPPARRLQVSFQTPTTYSHRGTAFTSLDLSRLEKSWRRALKHVPRNSRRIGRASSPRRGLRRRGSRLMARLKRRPFS